MDKELATAAAFLASYLPSSNLNRDQFQHHLVNLLRQRYQHHWHSTDPEQGSAYRCLTSSSEQRDETVFKACVLSHIDPRDVFAALARPAQLAGRVSLGERWTLWVDPGSVSIRLDNGNSGRNDNPYIELYGTLPDKLNANSISLADWLAGGQPKRPSVNIHSLSSSAQPEAAVTRAPSPLHHHNNNNDVAPSSPVKRSSKAIQILPPPAKTLASAAMDPSSPAITRSAAVPALLASPFIIPPTPLRPVPSSESDVFSPTPSGLSAALGLPPRSPSPLGGGLGKDKDHNKTYGALSPSSTPGTSPLFLHRSSSSSAARRGTSFSSARSASGSVSCSSSDDGDASDGGVFSSTESLSSSVTSVAETAGLDSGKHPISPRALASLPLRPTSPFTFPAHTRSHSSASNPTPFYPMSPSSASSTGLLAPPLGGLSGGSRSLPCSPTKPRRRGTRGGSGAGSQARHAAASSISSVGSSNGSVTSTGAPSPTTSSASTATATSNGGSRTREQAMAGTLTEHSGGKVGVLGGGVLLGLAGCAGAAKPMAGAGLGAAAGIAADPAKRRGRERRVRSRGNGLSSHHAAIKNAPPMPHHGQHPAFAQHFAQAGYGGYAQQQVAGPAPWDMA